MNNILITGANGQLGSELKTLNNECLTLNYKCFFTDKNTLDISNKDKIERFINENNINIIINCAAYTAVDRAEEEKELADLINYQAVKHLAEISKEKNITLIHISTDYVFDGTNFKPYCEDDKTNPVNYYGTSKLKGEDAFINSGAKGVIIRTSWLYSSFGNNFVKTILKLAKERDFLKVISDQVGTPTYAKDLAKVIIDIIPKIKNENAEIYHYSNEGVLSWFDFAKEIIKMAKIDCNIEAIESIKYQTLAKRPYYSLLNKEKIKNTFNIKIPYWKDSLDTCLKELGERR